MHGFAPVDACRERLGPGFWDEPWNAISNIAFILAALSGWVTARRLQVLTPARVVALVMAALIGVGSFLFHTLANHGSELADVVPIRSFVDCVIVLSIHEFGARDKARTLRISGITTTGLVAVFWFTSGDASSAPAVAEVAHDLLNGSEQHTPALIALWILAILVRTRSLTENGWLIGAAAVFTVSLVARTIDMHLCPPWAPGTHQLWYLPNGLMIALVLQALLRRMAANDAVAA